MFGQEAKESPKPPLAVRIVPMTFQGKGERTITLWQPSHHFYVVLTNVSDKPIRLWKEWCSWGYFCLSFEVKDETDKVTAVMKSPRPWSKNYPDWTIIPPGDHMVFEVTFGSDWDKPVLPEKGKSMQVKMRAIYEIRPDDDTKKAEVWTGRITSPEETYTIYR